MSLDKATGEETAVAATDPAKYLTLRSENVESFPPDNQQWTLEAPVMLYQPGTTAAEGEPIGTLEEFNATVDPAA